jgi:hypothetical protein
MAAHRATLDDVEQSADVFQSVVSNGWAYFDAYALDYPEDAKKWNMDQYRRAISPDYEDWTPVIVNAENTTSGSSKLWLLRSGISR